MDFALRCNSLKCRAQLTDQAVVTTCSHIFCLPCAEALSDSSTTRICPACNTSLNNQDDAAITNLAPTEDYKTSVLSGLNPSTIIECASRAMAFWTYQTTQEVFYQEFLMKSMTEKYHSLSGQMDKLITNANSEVSSLREKISAISIDNKDLESKNQQLAEAYKKKCKDIGQLHKLYTQAKQRQASGMMAEVAEQDASHVVQSLSREYGGAQPNQGRSRSDGSSGDARFAGIRSHEARVKGNPHAQSFSTTNRSHLPGSTHSGFLFRDQDTASRTASNRHATPLRQPLASLNQNSYARGAVDNFGLGNGVKFGRPPQAPFFPVRGSGASAYGGQ